MNRRDDITTALTFSSSVIHTGDSAPSNWTNLFSLRSMLKPEGTCALPMTICSPDVGNARLAEPSASKIPVSVAVRIVGGGRERRWLVAKKRRRAVQLRMTALTWEARAVFAPSKQSSTLAKTWSALLHPPIQNVEEGYGPFNGRESLQPICEN